MTDSLKPEKILFIEECERWIKRVSENTCDSPDICLAQFRDIDTSFRNCVMNRLKFADIPSAMRDNLISLAGYCAPAIDHEISEVITWNDDVRDFEVAYRLSVKAKPEVMAAQIDEFCTVAVNALTDPALRKGVTPLYILETLVDRYAQEEGVDDREEIDRIVSRLLARLYADGGKLPDMCPDTADNEIPDLEDLLAQSGNAMSLTELNDYLARLGSYIQIYVERTCISEAHPNCGAVTGLARWIKLPHGDIKMSRKNSGPEMDRAARELRWKFPELTFRINIDKESLRDQIKRIVDIIMTPKVRSILKTCTQAIRHDIEDIANQPRIDVSILLKNVIERNYMVRFIDVVSEYDKCATPEFFNVERANVPKVKTTRSAVVDSEGKVLYKGLYLVPLQ